MTTWDTGTPLGSDPMSTVDDRIRELKTAVQESLRAQASSGTEAIFPGADTSNPVYRYRGLKGSTAARPASGDYGLYFNETKNTIERDNGTAWEVVGTNFPAGTVLPFYQATPPVGWTQVTSQNDKVMRIVSGTGGGTGGTTALSGGITHTVASHTHAINSAGSTHDHELDNYGSPGTQGTLTSVGTHSGGGVGLYTPQAGSGTFQPRAYNITGSGSHSHGGLTGASTSSTDTITLAYADFLIASKD